MEPLPYKKAQKHSMFSRPQTGQLQVCSKGFKHFTMFLVFLHLKKSEISAAPWIFSTLSYLRQSKPMGRLQEQVSLTSHRMWSWLQNPEFQGICFSQDLETKKRSHTKPTDQDITACLLLISTGFVKPQSIPF